MRRIFDSIIWLKGHAGFADNEAADEAAAAAGGLVAAEADSLEPPKAMLHKEVDAAATQMWCDLWDNTLGHRQTRYWFPNGPDPKFAFDMIRLPKLICSQVVAFVTGHCHLNRHQALIDDAFTEQIRKQDGNEGADGEPIIPPADPTCTMCKFDPTQQDKEETPLHLMTECVGLWQLRHKIFGVHNPEPPFQYPVYKIVAFLREANIPSFPMQPYLEEQCPTAPTEFPDPQPQPLPPDHPPPTVQDYNQPNSPAPQQVQSDFPDGDRWYHTYLYISNPQPKPHRERELLNQPHMRPLRY